MLTLWCLGVASFWLFRSRRRNRRFFILPTLLIRCRVGSILINLALFKHPLNYRLLWENPTLENWIFLFALRTSLAESYNSWKYLDSRN